MAKSKKKKEDPEAKPTSYFEFAKALDTVLTWLDKSERKMTKEYSSEMDKALDEAEKKLEEFRTITDQFLKDTGNPGLSEAVKDPSKISEEKKQVILQLEGVKREVMNHRNALKEAIKQVEGDKPSKKKKGRRRKKFRRAGGKDGWMKM